MSSPIYLLPSDYVLTEHIAGDRTPYVYLIGWSKLNTFYYGRRTAKNCHPSEFWVTYSTSSWYVEQFVKEHGDPDIIQIRRTFDSIDKCVEWETLVLRRIDAANRKDFLNKRNTHDNWDSTGKLAVRDKDGNQFMVSLSDPRYLSGELECLKLNINLTEEHKKAISVAMTGRTFTEEHKINLGNSRRGIKLPWSKETYNKRMEFLGSLTKDEKSIKFGRHMLDLSDEDRMKYSMGSSLHNYSLVDPAGNTYTTHSILLFAKEHQLNSDILYKKVGAGIIRPSKFGRPSKERVNTNGWKIDIID